MVVSALDSNWSTIVDCAFDLHNRTLLTKNKSVYELLVVIQDVSLELW